MGLSSENVNIDNFEDFGDEVYPTFDSPLRESTPNVAKFNNKYAHESRYRHNNDGSDLSEAISKEIVGENCKDASDTERNEKESKTKTRSEEYKKSSDGTSKCPSAMFNTDIPNELGCHLCKEIFKDAVMIPCCQHSFCDRCIRSTLTKTRRCPKCSSTKCTVDDLLPNLSLRQAIERFIEAQTSIGGMDNLLPKDAPDGESGIQAIEASCAVSIRQQHFNSPSATGKGSNMAASESAQENKRNTAIKIRLDDKPLKAAVPTPVSTVPTNVGSTNYDKEALPEAAKHKGELHVGANEPKLPRYPQENMEGNMPIQRRNDLAFNNQDGPGFFPQRHNKYNRRGDRTCYFCGSPSHFIRDCPSKFSGEAGFQGGASGYSPQVDWVGPAFNQYRPPFNMYGNPGVVPFDTGAFPVLPFQMPSYVPPFYPGMSDPYGYMRMGGMGPTIPAGAERPFVRPDYMDPRGGWYGSKSTSDHPDDDYEDRSDDYRYTENQRKPPQQRLHGSDTESLEEPRSTHKRQSRDKYYSSDEDRRFNRKQTEKGLYSERERDKRPHHFERSISEASSDRYSGGRQRKGHQQRTSSSSKHHEESTLESRPVRERQGGSSKGKGVSERKTGSGSRDHGSEAERWEMVDGSDDDYRRERERYRQRRRQH